MGSYETLEYKLPFGVLKVSGRSFGGVGETSHGIRSPDTSVHTVCRHSGDRPGHRDLKELRVSGDGL